MIYVRGDTHGEIANFSDEMMPGQSSWTQDDTLIVCGDFGFIFHCNLAEKNNLDMLSRKPYTTLFVCGNHENYDALERYPEEVRYGAPVRKITDNIFWLQNGFVYTIEGKTFFVMGGGYSRDKAWRLQYEKVYGEKIWFKQEMPTPEQYLRAIATLETRDMKVDYIITHTAPRTIIPRLIYRAPDPHEAELNGFLDWIYRHEKTQFHKWFFGHFHLDDEQVNDRMVACYHTVYRIE